MTRGRFPVQGKVQLLWRVEEWGQMERKKEDRVGQDVLGDCKQDQDTRLCKQQKGELSPISRAVAGNVFMHLVVTYNIGGSERRTGTDNQEPVSIGKGPQNFDRNTKTSPAWL